MVGDSFTCSLTACPHRFSEVAAPKSSFTGKETLAQGLAQGLQLLSGSAGLKPRALDPKSKVPIGGGQLAKRQREAWEATWRVVVVGRLFSTSWTLQD